MTEKRFKEIISTQKVIDNKTGKEYDCLLDNDFYDLVNELAEENEQLKKDNVHLKVMLESLQDTYSGLLKLVHGFDGDVE